MEQMSDARTLVERGETLLLQGRVQEAAAEFSRAAQLEPSLAGAHLGVGEANLALGAFGVVYVACRQTQLLAPDTADGALARAILSTLDRRYEAAIVDLDLVESLQPGRAYAHALRAYCLRQLGNSYDAALAQAKAARLSGSRDLADLFPRAAAPAPTASIPPPPAPPGPNAPYNGPRPWDQRSPLARRMVRLRFATRSTSIVTMTLLVLNVAVYLVGAALSGNFVSPYQGVFVNPATGVMVGAPNPVYSFGLQQGLLIQQDPIQAYRFFTAMFLHASILHIGLNMWSLFAVGVITERIFGGWRYTLLYFAAGLAGGIAQAVATPNLPALGASGAIFGIFGAFGAFILMRRRQLGPVANNWIGQWLFFLVINIFFSVSVPGIGAADHFGGLIVGFLLGALFVTTSRRKRAL